jgi:hypothetical protein
MTITPPHVQKPLQYTHVCGTPSYDLASKPSTKNLPKESLVSQHTIPPAYQVNQFLPFDRLRVKIFLPVFDFRRAKYPCLRFWTLRDGLYVFRGADREVDVEKLRFGGAAGAMCRGRDVSLGSVGREGWEVNERAEKDARSEGVDVEAAVDIVQGAEGKSCRLGNAKL